MLVIRKMFKCTITLVCFAMLMNICIFFNASAAADSLSISVKYNGNAGNTPELTDRNISSVRCMEPGTTLEIRSDKDIGAIYIAWDRQQVPWTLRYKDKPRPSTTEPTKTTTTEFTTEPTTTTTTTQPTTNTTTADTTTTTTADTNTTQSNASTDITSTEENAGNEANQNKYLAGIGVGSHNEDGFVTLRGGTNGFLHEFVKITNPGRTLTLTLDKSVGIADIYAFESGRVPGWVQQWSPMLEKADMLLYSCHADDEHLWFGGTLPVYAGEYKKKVQVAYMIRHGKSRSEYIRNHELLDGLWRVGVRNYPMISDFEDYFASDINQAKKIYNEEELIKYTVMLLRRFKPDVLIGHDPRGEYGHGVHSLCSNCLQKAIPLSKDPTKYRESAESFGVWNIKKCYLHLYEKNRIIMDWSVPLKAFGGKTGFQMAKEGYKCHSSQANKWFYVQGKGDKYDSRSFGLYYTTVGKDVLKNDFFEHIAPVIPVTSAWSKKTDSTSTTAAPTTVTQSETLPFQTTVSITTTSQRLIISGLENDKNNIIFLLIPGLVLITAAAAFIIFRFYKKGILRKQSSS